MQGLMYQPKLLDHRWSRISQKNNVIQFQLIQYQSGFAKGCFRCSFSNSVVLPFCLHCFGFIFAFFLRAFSNVHGSIVSILFQNMISWFDLGDF